MQFEELVPNHFLSCCLHLLKTNQTASSFITASTSRMGITESFAKDSSSTQGPRFAFTIAGNQFLFAPLNCDLTPQGQNQMSISYSMMDYSLKDREDHNLNYSSFSSAFSQSHSEIANPHWNDFLICSFLLSQLSCPYVSS